MKVNLFERNQGLGSARFHIPKQGLCCALLFLVLLGGCVGLSESKKAQLIPRFHLEARAETLNDPRMLRVQLPISRTVIPIAPVPAIPGFDLEAVDLQETAEGMFLRFTLKSHGRMELMRLADANRGRRLVLVFGEEAIGAWRIDRIPTNGELWIYPEIDPAELNHWVNQVKQELNAGVGR